MLGLLHVQVMDGDTLLSRAKGSGECSLSKLASFLSWRLTYIHSPVSTQYSTQYSRAVISKKDET